MPNNVDNAVDDTGIPKLKFVRPTMQFTNFSLILILYILISLIQLVIKM
jgi:hypothetical protein